MVKYQKILLKVARYNIFKSTTTNWKGHYHDLWLIAKIWSFSMLETTI
ncbi:hypothetical protein Godav_028457 [Gossypium davidsonii]|uniref:Uncharacterized protein n=1 Tax=Gossypium davidsonii TaxID=34287 RepID=A0A7J8S0X3_GOSDV|nr:hypothetical protein [Gossypium davidsonii]